MMDTDKKFTYSKVESVEIIDLIKKELTVYPNPATESVVVEYPFDSKVQISIFNSLGQFQELIVTENISTTINLQHLPAGVYFLHLNTEGVNLIKKIIKR